MTKLDGIIERHQSGKWELIPLLQDVQETFGYVPPETIEPIATALNLFPSQVQGVITFYAGFSLKPKGKYVCKVCRGTACHVKGAARILDAFERELGLEVRDGKAVVRFDHVGGGLARKYGNRIHGFAIAGEDVSAFLVPALVAFGPALSAPPAEPSLPVLEPRPAAPRADEGDEESAFIAGLAKRGLHEMVVKEATKFLDRRPSHRRGWSEPAGGWSCRILPRPIG